MSRTRWITLWLLVAFLVLNLTRLLVGWIA